MHCDFEIEMGNTGFAVASTSCQSFIHKGPFVMLCCIYIVAAIFARYTCRLCLMLYIFAQWLCFTAPLNMKSHIAVICHKPF